MKYLKIWTSFLDVIELLEDAEIGRLFRMMMTYAESGNEPETFGGNERFLWPAARQQIDLMAEKNEILRQNGMKGGRPKNQSEPDETKENQRKPDESCKEKKRKEKECKEKDYSLFDRFWSAWPKKVKKPEAMRAFEKLNVDEALLTAIMAGMEKWKKSDQWTRDGGRYVPNPATWLNNRQWEDEVSETAVKPRTVIAQAYSQRDYTGEDEEALRRWAEMPEAL